MTVFESFKTKSIDELTEWFAKNGGYDGTPWTMWFDKNYCLKCEGVTAYVPEYHNKEMEFGYCELYGKCKFFEDVDIDDVLDDKFIIKMWLESEVDDGTEE